MKNWKLLELYPVADLSYVNRCKQILVGPKDQYSQLFFDTGSDSILISLGKEWSWGKDLHHDMCDYDQQVFSNIDYHHTLIAEHAYAGKLARILKYDLLTDYDLNSTDISILETLESILKNQDLLKYKNIKLIIEFTNHDREILERLNQLLINTHINACVWYHGDTINDINQYSFKLLPLSLEDWSAMLHGTDSHNRDFQVGNEFDTFRKIGHFVWAAYIGRKSNWIDL